MTKDQLAALHPGDTLHHTRAANADGTPLRARVNGRMRTWKRDPDRFQLPMKHGLRHCFYIDQTDCHEWEMPT
jgi:hypothetical protein